EHHQDRHDADGAAQIALLDEVQHSGGREIGPDGRRCAGDVGHLTQPASLCSPGPGMDRPESEYSRSLLRKVRIEMPRMLAAWVRLPRQWSSVSRIRSRSTSATVRPTRLRVATAAEVTASRTEELSGALLCGPTCVPSGRRMASGAISGPCANNTARWMVFSSSRTLPRQGCDKSKRSVPPARGRNGTPLASAYLRAKCCDSARISFGRSRK